MSTPKFAEVHNLVAFLSKPTESDGFEQIVDFLNANPIKYALTVNPTVYTSCIEQFWTTKAKTINGEVELQALLDGKKAIITESTIRSDLQPKDAEGVDYLPNAVIFEQLTLMGTVAFAIICLATNHKFNSSKYIFESMVKNLDSVTRFLMYPRNIRKVGKDFTRRVTPLFPTMLVQAQEEMGEDEAVNKEMYESLERAATIATSLDAEQDRGDLYKLLLVQIMAASTIIISSNSYDKSVGSPPSRTTIVVSPTGLCGLVPYLDSDSDSPDEMAPPEYITPLSATLTFLFTDSSKDSDPSEAFDSSKAPPLQDPYVTTIARWRSRVTTRSSSPSDFPIAPITAPPETHHRPSSSSSPMDSSPVYSLSLDAPGQAYFGSPTRVVSPRLGYPPVRAPRHSEAFLHWCSALLSTFIHRLHQSHHQRDHYIHLYILLDHFASDVETTRLQDAVRIANNLMDKKLKGYVVKDVKNKRRFDTNHRDNRGQQPPFKQQNTGGQNVARAYTAGQCTVRCHNYRRKGHLERDCRSVMDVTTQGTPGLNQKVVTCFECGAQGHYRKNCPKVKNQNRENKARVPDVRGKAYVLGGGDTNPGSNTVM
nr:hypothetical protein [Tanacetum cinerariifolium]